MYALRQRVPTSAEIPIDYFEQLFSRNVAYVFISKVGYAHYRALLYADFHFRALWHADHSDLKTARFVFLNNLGTVDFNLLYLKSPFNYVYIMTDIILNVCVFLGGFKHSENIVFLNVPNVTLI